jgi:hypothetical protein
MITSESLKSPCSATSRPIAERHDEQVRGLDDYACEFAAGRCRRWEPADVRAYIAHRPEQGIVAVKGARTGERVRDVGNADVNRELTAPGRGGSPRQRFLYGRTALLPPACVPALLRDGTGAPDWRGAKTGAKIGGHSRQTCMRYIRANEETARTAVERMAQGLRTLGAPSSASDRERTGPTPARASPPRAAPARPPAPARRPPAADRPSPAPSRSARAAAAPSARHAAAACSAGRPAACGS